MLETDGHVADIGDPKQRNEMGYIITERQGELGRSIHAQACIWLRPGVRRVCDVEKLMEREDCAGSSLEF